MQIILSILMIAHCNRHSLFANGFKNIYGKSVKSSGKRILFVPFSDRNQQKCNCELLSSRLEDTVTPSPYLAPLKVMVFMDGTWLYYTLIHGRGEDCPINIKFGQDWLINYKVDWIKVQEVIENNLAKQLAVKYKNPRPIDIVRTNVFTSLRLDTEKDGERLKLVSEFYTANFNVVKFSTRGPQEKCVDISLAVEMLYMATVPDGYDVAVLVTGDKDFIPALQKTRMKGKRTSICSMRNSCNQDLSLKEMCLSDFDIIWLDDFLDEIVVPREDQNDEVLETTLMNAIALYIIRRPHRSATTREIGRLLQRTPVGKATAAQKLKSNYPTLKTFLETCPDTFLVEDVTLPGSETKDFNVTLLPDAVTKYLCVEELTQDLWEETVSEIELPGEPAVVPNARTRVSLEGPVQAAAPPATVPLIDARRSVVEGKPQKPPPSATWVTPKVAMTLTVPQLKDVLRRNNLTVAGVKDDLIGRVVDCGVTLREIAALFPNSSVVQDAVHIAMGTPQVIEVIPLEDEDEVSGEEDGASSGSSGEVADKENTLPQMTLAETEEYVLQKTKRFVMANKQNMSSRALGRKLMSCKLRMPGKSGTVSALDYIKRSTGSLTLFLKKYPWTFQTSSWTNNEYNVSVNTLPSR